MIDVSTLVNMNSVRSVGRPGSAKVHGGFVKPSRENPNPGGFTNAWESDEHQRQMRMLAQLNPNLRYLDRRGRLVSGHEYRQPHYPTYLNYNSILELVKQYNEVERPRVTAPRGTVRGDREAAEALMTPVRMRRRTARELASRR